MSRQKAIVYTRVSTDEQSEKGTSLETQRQACLKKAQDMGASVVECLADEGISGGTLAGRPGLLRALALIEEGEANILLCYDLSRLSRSVEHGAAIKRRVEAAGGRLAFVMGHYSDDEEGQLHYTIDNGFKQYEKGVIRRRTMTGRRKRAEEGLQPSRTISPYGFHIVTGPDILRGDYPADQLGRYVVIEEEARAVRRMFASYASGSSLRGICAMLNADHVPPRKASEWSAAALRCILKNPVYVGRPTFGRTKSATDEGRRDRGLKHTTYRVATTKEQQVVLAAPALVDEATFARCQELLATNRANLSGNPQQAYLLSTTLRCPHCGKGMTGQRGRGPQYSYYRCRTWKVCPTNYQARIADHAILQGMVNAAHSKESLEQALATYSVPNPQEADAERLRQELEAISRKETVTAKAQVDALLAGRSTDVYDGLLAEIDAKRKAIQARLSGLDTKPVERINPKTDAAKIAQAIEDLEEVLLDTEYPTAKKRAILRRVLRAVHIEGETFRLELGILTVKQILICYRNMAYHAGQINYIQTLYGDQEFHLPPNWR